MKTWMRCAGLVGLAWLLSACTARPPLMGTASAPRWVLTPAQPVTLVAEPAHTASGGAATAKPDDEPAGASAVPAKPGVAGPPTSSPSSDAAATGGGSGGSGLTGRVLDELDRPVAGALVMLRNGKSATTSAAGSYRLSGPFAAGMVTVSAPGFATSSVQGLDGLPTLHLRRSSGLTAPFELRTHDLVGQVPWPESAGVRGVAYYVDGRGTSAQPARVLEDGALAISVTPYAPGSPTGAVLVVASDLGGAPWFGLTPAFNLGAGDALPPMQAAAADHVLSWDTTPSAELPDVEGRLESLLGEGVPPVWLNSLNAASGSLQCPLPGTLPGTLCFDLVARDLAGAAESHVRRLLTVDDLTSGTPIDGALPLDVPTVFVNSSAHEVTWSRVSGATGYRVSVRLLSRAEPSWEAWAEGPGSATVPEGLWPGEGLGEVTVEAIDAIGYKARQVASFPGPRQLRVAPWEAAELLRISTRRVGI